MSTTTHLDTITISRLSLHLPYGLGPSGFGLTPPPPCQIHLSASVSLSSEVVEGCTRGDDFDNLGVNYSALSKAIYALTTSPERTWASPTELIQEVASMILNESAVETVDLEVAIPRAHLHANEVIYKSSWRRGRTSKESEVVGSKWRIEFRGMEAKCVVGLHPYEQKERQRIEWDLTLDDERIGEDGGIERKGLGDAAVEFVEASSYGTIEALAQCLTAHLLSKHVSFTSSHHNNDEPPAGPSRHVRDDPSITLTLRKPSALPFATPSITIHRTLSDFPNLSPSSSNIAGTSRSAMYEAEGKRVFIALGSNIGDRISHIRTAVDALARGGCKLVRTSRLYESEPMYVEDQARFINGVIEIRTDLSARNLLGLLKRTEREVGRTKTFRNGPRVVDLDLLFYGNEKIKEGQAGDSEDEDGVGWMEVPHPLIQEREFVLRPLADIAPELIHPSRALSIRTLLSRLPISSPSALCPIIPLHSPSSPLRLSPGTRPLLMAIFNATPDSFSDGDPSRTSSATSLSTLTALFDSWIPYAPDILDIGGMSTRPNAEPCTESEEISRVVPLITTIRASAFPWANIPISIDTYRPAVATAAVQAGANIINDVRGGREPGMLETMASLDVPVVLMHSRGDSTTMTTAEAQDYTAAGGVVQGVRYELAEMVERALEAGVKSWNIILDPGLGFAKNQEGNLKLLRHLADLSVRLPPSSGRMMGGGENKRTEASYPMLVGASRKGFVGKITQRENPKERTVGDAVINAWCVQSGVISILRVHDVRAAGESLDMSSAIRG